MSVIMFAAGALCVLITLWVFRPSHIQHDRIPGPSGWPIVGSAFEIPGKHIWRYWDHLAQRYGGICEIQILRQRFVILSDAATCHQVLNVHASVTSSRPGDVYTREIASDPKSLHIGLEPYTEKWKHQRRLLRRYFNNGAKVNYIGQIQVYEARKLARDLSKDVAGMIKHCDRFAAATASRMLFGSSSPDADSHEVARVAKIAHTITETLLPGYSVISFVPWARYLPEWIVTSKRVGRQRVAASYALQQDWLAFVNERLAIDTDTQTFMASMLQAKAAPADDIAALVEGIYLAASDTQSATLGIMLAALVLFPSTVSHLRQEVDRVVGRSRPPVLADKELLPLCLAFLTEVYRWRPVARFAVPHVATKTLVVNIEDKAYKIDEGTTIIANIWSICRDSSLYSNPDVFDIYRFVDQNGLSKKIPFTSSRQHVGFGYGRRICPGQSLADNSLFLALATLIWAFDFSCDVDESGKPIVPEVDALLDQGLVFRPQAFPFRMKARPGVDVDKFVV